MEILLGACYLQKKEREMQQQIEMQEETAFNIKETYDSLQQEVEIKTKKLKKVCGPYCLHAAEHCWT